MVSLDSAFIHVASVSEIVVGQKKTVTAGDLPILIINVSGSFYVIDVLCTHYGGDLSQGTLEGNIITCPNHGSKFDVTTGKVVSGPMEPLDRPDIENLTAYPLKLEKQEIYIKI